ncbi:unnamed protein product [Schistosoma turkestanicum]|nr:unnamed protein product [Schistosoma turkestanicum]
MLSSIKEKPKQMTLIILLVFIYNLNLAHCDNLDVSMSLFVEDLLSLRNQELFMMPYDKSLFSPFNGPFFKPLWELHAPYNYFAQYGFPNPHHTLPPILNTEFMIGDTFLIKESAYASSMTYVLTEKFTLFDLYFRILSKVAGDDYYFRIDQYDEELDSNDEPTLILYDSHQIETKPVRVKSITVYTDEEDVHHHTDEEVDSDHHAKNHIILGERLQPRMFLPLFIDIYRVLKRIHFDCEQNCKEYIANYEYVLWMYNWVICTILGSKPSYDVDGICPKLCRPRDTILIRNNSLIEQLINLTFKPINIINPFDVCSQLLHSVSGSCLVHGTGVYMHEFTCQCKSSAYNWRTVKSQTGCLLIPAIMKSKPKNLFRPTWNIECNEEMSKFCQNNPRKCYQRLKLIKDNRNDKASKLTLTSNVDISLWPHCLCAEGFTGIDCSVPFEPCEHLISNALIKPEQLMHSQLVPDDIDRPLLLFDDDDDHDHDHDDSYLKLATGNWLCGVPFNYGTCHSNGSQYYCQCNIGYEKDVDYSHGDNCWKQTRQQNHQLGNKCGQGVCFNGGKCINVMKGLVNYIHQHNNRMIKTNNNQVPMCQCQPGYTGLYCELKEGVWNEWNSWSHCSPHCGLKRYRSRLRTCQGDVGCIGSNEQLQKCSSKKCTTTLLVNSESDNKPNNWITFQQNNHNIIWFLVCLIIVEIFLIILSVIILEKYFF